MTLAEALVSLVVTLMFVISAFGYFSAARDMAVRMSGELFDADLLRLVADTLVRDLSFSGSGIRLQGDGFTPLVLGEQPAGKDWSESVTVYSNIAGKEVILCDEVEIGNKAIRAAGTSIQSGDRLLMRSLSDWQVVRVDRVSVSGGITMITLHDDPRGNFSTACGVTVISYSFDRRKRKLSRSENGGSPQPLLENCTDFKLRLENRITGERMSGSVTEEGLLMTELAVEVASGGRMAERRFPFLLDLLSSKFLGRPGSSLQHESPL